MFGQIFQFDMVFGWCVRSASGNVYVNKMDMVQVHIYLKAAPSGPQFDEVRKALNKRRSELYHELNEKNLAVS